MANKDSKKVGRVTRFVLWTITVRGKSKLVRNEKIKLRAVFLNNIAVGQFLGWLLAINAVHSAWVAAPLIVAGFVLAWLLHWGAAHWLNDLEE
jgi:hypothetical protein